MAIIPVRFIIQDNTDYEALNIKAPEPEIEIQMLKIDFNDIHAFNSVSEGITTIRTDTGTNYSANMDFKDFNQFYDKVMRDDHL